MLLRRAPMSSSIGLTLAYSASVLALQRRLFEEFERCQVYLAAATRKPLIACVELQLLERHMPAILERGFEVMLQQQRIEDLARLYSLAARVKALDQLKAAFKENIKKAGIALVMDVEKVRSCLLSASHHLSSE